MNAPKLFISYSWSNPDHEELVINLATELRESGVDVILDKWDLREGHDAFAFMEKMVTDPDIKKVAIICDKKYALKADGRAGGVGTETQIISKEVYENQAQEKFVAIVCERDEEGKAYLPTYYKSRIYIDLSEADKYVENFEKLLRWIFDQPLYTKPEIGNKPSFLSEGNHITLGTSAIFKRCIEAIRTHKPYAKGTFDEYCTVFSSNLEKFRIEKSASEFDDAVIKNIEEFLPSRNEVIQLISAIAQYSDAMQYIERLHRFFESMIPYMQRPEHVSQYNESDFDNYKFIIHELFLYALAIFLKYDQFEPVNYLLEQHYYLAGNTDYGKNAMVDFSIFRDFLRSLDHRNHRLKLQRTSLRADLLKDRSVGSGVDLRYIFQADFIAFIRAELRNSDWWPETLLYLGRFNSPLEIFSRSSSKAYFNKSKILLGINKPDELEPLLNAYQNRSRELPRWNFNTLSPTSLLDYTNLATRP